MQILQHPKINPGSTPACHYLIYSLANTSNLKQWKIKTNVESQLSRRNDEMQLHLFSDYKSTLPRYKWRHDSIQKTIINYLQSIQSPFTQLYIDIEGFDDPA